VNIRSLRNILAVKLEREQRSTNAYGGNFIPYCESSASIVRGTDAVAEIGTCQRQVLA
jgi:hypothetical protein